MNSTIYTRSCKLSGVLVSTMLILALSIAPVLGATRGPAPDGRTYFTVITGVGDAPYDTEAACLQFTASEMCIVGGDCFQFSRTDGGVQTRSQTSFEFHGSLSDQDSPVQIDFDGQGRADKRGRRSSIGAAAQAKAQDPVTGQKQVINMGFSGRETSPSRCQQLVDDFETAMSAMQN